MNTYSVSSAQTYRLVTKRHDGYGDVIEFIENRGKHKTQQQISNVITDLKQLIAKLPKYSSQYGREKNSHRLLTLALSLTKHLLYEEFIKDKTYKIKLTVNNCIFHRTPLPKGRGSKKIK